MFFLFLFHVSSFLDAYLGEWTIYSKYPSDSIYSLAITKIPEILNRYEIILFKNDRNSLNHISTDESLALDLFVNLNTDKSQGYAFKELPDEQFFTFAFSSTEKILKIENTENNLSYKAFLDPKHPHNTIITPYLNNKNPIFTIQEIDDEIIKQSYFIQHELDQSTFDILRYFWVFAFTSLIIVGIQAYYFTKNWKKEQEEYSRQMKQLMLKKLAEQQKQQKENDEESDSEIEKRKEKEEEIKKRKTHKDNSEENH